MLRSPSRRDALVLAGVGSVTALAGCSLLSESGPRYSLTSSPTGGTTLTDLFAWEPRATSIHVRRNLDALRTELLESGSVKTAAQPITPSDPTGTPPPAYAEHDGAYYRVSVTDVETVTLTRWEVWFEPVEQAPDDADVVENPTEGLSALDATVVDWAVRDAIGAVVDEEDVTAAPHGERGVVYFEPMAPDESDLVPDPPFEYVRVDPDTEFLDEPQTLRAHADEWSVETERYVNTAERVADSESALREILTGHVDASLDGVTGEARDVVEQVSLEDGIYVERAPISNGFQQVLDRLGIEDPAAPEESGASWTWRRYYAFEDSYYRTSLRVRSD